MHLNTVTRRTMRAVAFMLTATMGVIVLTLTLLYIFSANVLLSVLTPEGWQAPATQAGQAASVGSSFHYQFSVNGTLNETGSMEQSSSPYFWLNSGGQIILEDGVGKTLQGETRLTNVWRTLYSLSSGTDTDEGLYPQNLLRLVTRSEWTDVEEEVRFKITKINMTDTPNRDGWSGMLLMSRYQDGNNLYYAGIRMDGDAVIKKKYQGRYYTLAQQPVFSGGEAEFHKGTNPTFIPGNQWMGIKSVTKNNSDGSVTVELWLDKNDTGSYEKVLSATDRPGVHGSGVIRDAGYVGIRTDYMDLFFDDYKIREL